MDPNLLYWKSEGQSFLSRMRIWLDLLDPTLLFASDAEIQKARTLLTSAEKSEKDASVLTLSLSSVHADSGAVLPLVFRPPALLTISAPLAVASFLPYNTIKPALFWQLLLQSYNAGFNYANRNSSSEQQGKQQSLNRLLLIGGTISYATCAGVLPQISINFLHLKSAPVLTFFRSIVPIPLSAALAYFSVLTVRSEEWEAGIQVFDSNGNPVGISKAAGEKAVRETALSRAALFGATAAVPNLFVFLLHRTRLFQRNSLLVAPLRHISIALVLGLMIPVSFSLFPQLGTIKKEKLEEELQAAADNGHLFYHRGL
ncbi:putative sideroflexin-4 isoform 2 [Scophthalmus maximus]|uniref:Putative sideroflexin-4 isoform 2 n=2 Tax=Scophthalmus maximus TaxID=52904 RepID=A0A2U9CCP4_SCOMX|nr:putative sideroflexin-4 isoform 2 [Scophthalmus maximus]